MISIAFALALAAAPAPASGAEGCTLLNPSACRDAGALARDAGFRTALRQYVGERRTGYLTGAGQAYGEALTVLSGPAEPVRRVRSFYVFAACADAACDDRGSVVLQPDGELAAVAILHSDCVGLRHVGDCAAREVLSILRSQNDDLGLIETLSAQARQDLAARPITPGSPIRVLDRVEVIVLDAPPQTAVAQAAAPQAAAPQIAKPPQIAAQPAPAPIAAAPRIASMPPPAVAQVPAAPAPRIASLPPPPPRLALNLPPPPVARAPAPAPPAPEPDPEPAQPLLSEVTVEAAPVPVQLAPLPPRPQPLPLARPPKMILVRTPPRVVVPPEPKPPREGWQWHWTPADCRDPTPSEGAIALGPVSVDVKGKACRAWKR